MTTEFVVVRNDEEQYSVWPADMGLPPGWHSTGFAGTEQQCLDHVAEVWTDLRPLSVRRVLADHAGATERTEIPADRLRLRELLPAEADALLAGHRQPNWAADYPLEGTLAAARGLVGSARAGTRRAGFGMYQVVRGADGVVVGDIGFHAAPDGEGSVEIGYGLAPSARGQGLMTEAAAAITRWALSFPGVSAVHAETTNDNQPSVGVLLRAGFTLVSTVGETRHYLYTAAAAQEGPAQEGPAQEGPAQEGPAQEGPAQEGPAQEGPAHQGPAQEGAGNESAESE
jgi:RimJ/RimL family protein N-acetyltransferase/uncharacterized protein YbdZ (MbtH family)